jgi:transcriptional regulator with XRE-family HTH domain
MGVADRFGQNLRRARRDASLHRTEIGLLERGERIPRIDTAIKLAAAVGVPVSDLLAGIGWTPGNVCPGGFVGGEP